MARFVKYYDLSGHWLSKKPEYGYWWMDLVYLANYEDSKFFINGFLIECKRGELAWSVLSLAQRWNVNRQRVRTFLKSLEKDLMITSKSNQQTTIITICNYSKYQDYKPTDKPTPNQRLTNGKPTPNHIIEIQEIQEVLEEDTTTNVVVSTNPKKQTVEKLLLLDFGIDEDLADDFLKLRKAKRAPITKTVCKQLQDEAIKAGITINQAIEICIGRNWQNFNASWDWQGTKPVNGQTYSKYMMPKIDYGEYEPSKDKMDAMKTIDGEVISNEQE